MWSCNNCYNTPKTLSPKKWGDELGLDYFPNPVNLTNLYFLLIINFFEICLTQPPIIIIISHEFCLIVCNRENKIYILLIIYSSIALLIVFLSDNHDFPASPPYIMLTTETIDCRDMRYCCCKGYSIRFLWEKRLTSTEKTALLNHHVKLIQKRVLYHHFHLHFHYVPLHPILSLHNHHKDQDSYDNWQLMKQLTFLLNQELK